MDKPFTLPADSTVYILLQRTKHMKLHTTALFRLLRRIRPAFDYTSLARVEAFWRGRAIREDYLKEMMAEYDSIRNSLPEVCHSILDIGCGMAGIDMFLGRHYQGSEVAFYLLDQTRIEQVVYYSYKDKGAFYNSLEIARTALAGNGVSPTRITLLEANDRNEIRLEPGLSLVISLLSWGFHYPVSTYLDRVHELLASGGMLILDVRKGTDGMDRIQHAFGNCRILLDGTKYHRVLAVKA